MIAIIVAHHLEARDLIERFDLRARPDVTARPVFENADMRVVISGPGTVSAAVGTTLALSLPAPARIGAVLNFGICGASSEHRAGSLFHIHSVRSCSGNRCFYPDMLLNLGLPQASLETRESPYVSGDPVPLTADLVDMEGAGFFEAARAFLSPDRIFLLKVVSDHGQTFEEIRQELPALLRAQTPSLRETVKRLEHWIDELSDILPEHQQLLDQVTEQLKLTETQYQKLLFLVRARGRSEEIALRLSPFLDRSCSNRQQRSAHYHEIVDALSLSLV